MFQMLHQVLGAQKSSKSAEGGTHLRLLVMGPILYYLQSCTLGEESKKANCEGIFDLGLDISLKFKFFCFSPLRP